MGYENNHRDVLKEDRAREHWEEHVQCNSKMHHAQRHDRAYSHWCNTRTREPTLAQVDALREEMEEATFQAWYDLKLRKGFAQFGDPFAAEEEDTE